MMQVAQPVQYGYGPQMMAYQQQMQYQQQQMVQQQEMRAPAVEEQEEQRPFPSIAQEPKNSRFTVFNVPDINKLKVSAGETFKMKVLQSRKNEGEYRVEYDHNGDAHNVSVSYDNKALAGTPFQLIGRDVTIDHRPGDKEFHLNNVYKLDRLDLQTDLPFEMFEGEEKHSYVVKHQPQDSQTYDVKVRYNGKDVQDGAFTLAPKNKPQPQARIAAAPYMQQQVQQQQQQQMSAQQVAPTMVQVMTPQGPAYAMMTPQGMMMAPMMPMPGQGVAPQQMQQMPQQQMNPHMYAQPGFYQQRPMMQGSAQPMRR